MEWGVLGPVEVRCDGVPVPVTGSRERHVLARLLLSPNQVVSQDALIDDLWEEDPPEGAGQALWVYVSRLRKALRTVRGDGVLETHPPGYRLRVEPGELDAERFEALAGDARRQAAAGDPAGAASTFREALALWRGPALGDVAGLPFARAEAARLEESRLGALEERIAADLASGRHSELIGELAGLTRDHPLRERLWAHRMLALYRAGRQAEALRAYQDLRRYLGEELGIEPSEELRALEGSILRQEAHLGHTPTPVEAVVPEPAPGVVTLVFTDLVGSTEMLDRLGDEAADEVRRRHFASLRQALATHGGAEVKSLGDGLMAVFASPVAALRCAIEIQQATTTGDDEPVAVRVGIHAGEPITEEDDFFGTPVVVAQRLCGRAAGGQILVSALVQGLAGHRAGCSFTNLGGLVLKGLSEPVSACEVVWTAPAAAKALPLPAPLQRSESSAFVGRGEEMGRLERAWTAVQKTEQRLVLLAGEPGIGKTRLATELARLSHRDGATVLFGRCEEGMGVPYQPFVEALTTYLGQTPAPTLGGLAGELSRLVPELRGRVEDLPSSVVLDPDTERYRLFQAVAGWLTAMSDDNPVVLVIDDLHWATRPTLALLSHLVRSGDTMRLLVVVTYRDTELDVTAEMSDAVADLLRQPGVERLRVTGLDEAAVAAFLEANARQALDDEGRAFVPTLHRETGGNPFFVGQVLRHLTESGAVERHGGRWVTAGAGIPDDLADVISRRLARLPEETGDILAQAAVLGVTFELAVLVHAAGGVELSVLRALDPAIAARLVAETGERGASYRFVHALVRGTVYDTLASARRLELHANAGRAVEAVHAGRLDDHLPALAHHYARSGSADRDHAIEYATRAGERSSDLSAHGEAAGWYRQALDLLEAQTEVEPSRRCDVLIALGAAQRRAFDAAYAEPLQAAVRIADQLGDTERLARAALAHSRGTFSESFTPKPELIALYRRTLTALGPADSVIRARVLACLAGEMANTAESSAHEVGAEALDLVRRLADPATTAFLFSVAWQSLFVGGWNPELMEAWKEELGATASQAHDPLMQYMLTMWVGVIATVMGESDETERYLRESNRMAAESNLPFVRWMADVFGAGEAMRAGRLDDAEALAHRAFELASTVGIGDGFRMYMGQLFWIRYEQGRLADVAEVFLRGGRKDDAHPLTYVYLCLVLCHLDRSEEARGRFEAVVDDLAHRALPLAVLGALAEIAVELGDTPRAAQLQHWLAPYEQYFSTVGPYSAGPVAHHLGVLAMTLGDREAAARHFVASLDLAQRMRAPTWAARTRLSWATMLAGGGLTEDREQARDLATQALATAEELGLGRLAEQARALLGSVGSGPL